MKLTINEALLKYNLINGMKFVDGEYSIPRELKVKFIRWKLNLEKVKNDFIDFQQKAMEEVKTEEYNYLVYKEDKTEEEVKRLDEVVNQLNDELSKITSEKSMEIIEINSLGYITEEEFDSIIEVNIENSPVINGNSVDPNTFIELLHQEFVR